MAVLNSADVAGRAAPCLNAICKNVIGAGVYRFGPFGAINF